MKNTNITIYCRNCKRETTHKILKQVENITFDDEYDTRLVQTYSMAQCLGCEDVCLYEKSWYSEDRDPETGEPEFQCNIYPDPTKERNPIEDIHSLPERIRLIYEETLSAYNKHLHILTSIGLRTIVEGVCISFDITESTLELKIDKLCQKQYITPEQAKLLHLQRYMGNASAHELLNPKDYELDIGILIIESLIVNAYVLPIKARQLRTGIPANKISP